MHRLQWISLQWVVAAVCKMHHARLWFFCFSLPTSAITRLHPSLPVYTQQLNMVTNEAKQVCTAATLHSNSFIPLPTPYHNHWRPWVKATVCSLSAHVLAHHYHRFTASKSCAPSSCIKCAAYRELLPIVAPF